MNIQHLVHAACVSIQPLAILFAADPASSAAKAALSFAPTIANSSRPPGPAPEGMVWISRGEFSMGSEEKCVGISLLLTGHGRRRASNSRVYVDGFWMDATDVTNAEFFRIRIAMLGLSISTARCDAS